MLSQSIFDTLKDFLSVLALLSGAIFAAGGTWAIVRRGLHDVTETQRELKDLKDKHQSLAKELRERCCTTEISLSRVTATQEQDNKTLRILLGKTLPLLPDNNTVCKLK